jgi:phage-related minor tail protein
MSRRRATATALLGLALAGCGGSIRVTAPLGRSIAAAPTRPAPVAPTRAPVGDPPAERGGTIPAGAQAAEGSVSRAGVANSPQLALRRYALAYVNWHASRLEEREHQLVAMSIGAAKQTAQQTAAARSGVAALIASHVANSGQVVAIAPGEGPDAGQWVIVTEEHTTGTGGYAGLPPAPHLTLAQVSHLDGGWVVSAWNPAS